MAACLLNMETLHMAYFTLEYGYDDDEKPRPYLCSWDEHGTHRNLGRGPRPEEREFVRVCLSRVDG
jgi:hypothetical protein